MKIALYGGTFDPIHYGHLIIAEEIRYRFSLDKVYFIPSALPPHKQQQQITPSMDRFLMVILATLSNPYFLVSSVEIDRGGTSYSIETIRFFKKKFGQEVKLYFLMGLDAFWEISTWRDVEELLTSCQFIITNRPGLSLQEAVKDLPKILPNHYQRLSFAYYKLEDGSSILGKAEDRSENFFMVEVPGIDISSSLIRLRIYKNGPWRYLVPPAVEEYINKHSLYSKGE